MNKTIRKVVLITGGSSGIGKSLALEYARKGYHIVIGARKEDKLQVVKTEIECKYTTIKVLCVKLDVTIEEDCKVFIRKALSTFSRIDCLINNAGISMLAMLKEVDIKVIRQLMDVNFYGTVYCTKYAIDHIINTQGNIIGISSIAGIVGLPSRTGYSASKFAMQGFLESVYSENYDKGIHVMLACPGFTQSDIRKNQLIHDGSILKKSSKEEAKMMTSEEVAIKIYKGMVRRKLYLIMTTEGKLVHWIKKLAPKFLIRQVFNKFKKENNM